MSTTDTQTELKASFDIPTQPQFIETIFSNLQAIQQTSAVNTYME